jgi:hypothetical protein
MDVPLLPTVEAKNAHTTDRRRARRPRVELITRSERRRRWSIEQEQEIVAESLNPDTTPTEVARKHAVSSGLLCKRRGSGTISDDGSLVVESYDWKCRMRLTRCFWWAGYLG